MKTSADTQSTGATSGDPKGNAVRQAMVSQATRDMAKGKNADLTEKIEAVRARRDALMTEIKSVQSELGVITARIRGAGMLPRADYRRFCDRQAELKKLLPKLESEISSLKREMIALESSRMDNKGPWSGENPVLVELRAVRQLLSAIATRIGA